MARCVAFGSWNPVSRSVHHLDASLRRDHQLRPRVRSHDPTRAHFDRALQRANYRRSDRDHPSTIGSGPANRGRGHFRDPELLRVWSFVRLEARHAGMQRERHKADAAMSESLQDVWTEGSPR